MKLSGVLMNREDLRARRCASSPRATWIALLAALAVLGLAGPVRAAQPIIWDDDEDGMDDRMETVQLEGYRFSFEDADTTLRQRFQVTRAAADLLYGVYVVFEAPPTTADLLALTLLGMPVLHRYEAIPSVRSVATFAQASAALATISSVERLEVIPLAYGFGREDAASAGERDWSDQVFPTWSGTGGADGTGVVVAILDSGINDAPSGGWPGHESLIGRIVGGASFTAGDSLLDTGRDQSVNPADNGGLATRAHGTHVAGLVLGSGGSSGYAPGLAPGARAVDVKVISDLGFGAGVAEAIDWCIHNRARDWGAGSAWQGIDVLNLSLSSLDRSDGNDVAAQLAAKAVELGIVVVAAMGNDGLDHHVPSPASGDGVLAVGAYDAQRTGAAGDDQFASFSNRGPRDGDADLNLADEQKPELLAPGVAVTSADGDLSTDGAQYVRKSGTSMSTALASGMVALLRSEFPSLTPAQLSALLRFTARRGLGGLPAGTPGVDPRWHSARGWGAADLYAARLEALQPERSQVRRLALAADHASVTATLWTMRERGAAHFVLERAPDQSGVPGTFAALDSVAAGGDSSLAGNDLWSYPLVRSTPAEERGLSFWYRVAYTENGVRHEGPARKLALPSGPAAARLEFRIVHNAYDHDLGGGIVVGGAQASSGSGPPGYVTSPPTLDLPGTSAAVASEWVSGTSTFGNVAWDFAIDVPADFAPGTLPPTHAQPWILSVEDNGFLNRSGRIESFRLIWKATSGDFVYTGGPVPRPTVEGSEVQVQVPAALTGVGDVAPDRALRVGPNPVRSGGAVVFSLASVAGSGLEVFDVTGRAVARFPAGSARELRWETRDRDGRPLPAGVYLARAGGVSARVVVLTP